MATSMRTEKLWYLICNCGGGLWTNEILQWEELLIRMQYNSTRNWQNVLFWVHDFSFVLWPYMVFVMFDSLRFCLHCTHPIWFSHCHFSHVDVVWIGFVNIRFLSHFYSDKKKKPKQIWVGYVKQSDFAACLKAVYFVWQYNQIFSIY